MRRSTAVAGAFAAGLTILFTGPAAQAAATGTVYVPEDFVDDLSDTRATGSYDLVGAGLRIWTTGSTGTDKVAEYVAADDVSLAEAGEPELHFTNTSGGGAPGFQLVVDFDGDTSPDGILVGEDVYGDDWWATNSAKPFVKSGAPVTGGGSGSAWHGTLDGWRAAFPDAEVLAWGFSLGSGVKGDGVITSVDFAGTTYTFAEHVRLSSKNQCKNGGWATSTLPEFRNQGECVASFAKAAER
ncbi:hypothetical protein ACI78R_06840 [Geodermatophilus sp. SYSU D01106]